MNANLSTDRKLIRMFANVLSIFVILALAFPAIAVAHAAPSSPFVGHWEATDVDGSEMGLNIGGRPTGPFQITWTDNYISYCGGEAGIIRGTGWLNEGDPNLLEADVHLECFTTGGSLDFHVTLRFHPATNTLSIRYWFGQVTIWHRPGGGQAEEPPFLGLRVNYGHDWVESFYEGGHTVWVTVTDGDGNLKATAELVTEPKDFWGGETGFQTQWSDWLDSDGNPMENPPDIQPYDWVYGWVDNGASAQVQIGEVSGTVHLADDFIEGTIHAPWFSEELEVDCHSWGAPLPEEILKYDTVLPDGEDMYSCSWAGEWDIQPYQDVGVGYAGPDGHWVANAFFALNPRIVASEAGDWFWMTEFKVGTLDLFLYESADKGAALLWSGTAEVTDTSGITFVGSDIHGQDLMPGNYLIVSDGVNSKGLVLQPISVTMFDTQYDFMAGFAPAGLEVWAAAGPQDWQERIMVMADPDTGEWFADFAGIGFDITEEMQPWSYASIYDEDGDANEGGVPPLETWIAVYTYDYGKWEPGSHGYYLGDNWGHQGNPVLFGVSADVPLYDGYALLRGMMMWAQTSEGCQVIDAINPDQLTRFHSGWPVDYPMTYEQAVEYFDTLAPWVVVDDGAPVELELYRIVPFSTDTWQEYFCTFTADLVLDASQPDWVDSGITVSAGQSFTVEAFGLMNPCSDTYPNGADYCIFYTPQGAEGVVPYENEFGIFPGPGLPFMALLGRIDDGGPFYVGAGGTFTAEQAGTLWFTPNDNLRTDNQGAYSVVVRLDQ